MIGKYQARTYTLDNVIFVEFNSEKKVDPAQERARAAKAENQRITAILRANLDAGMALVVTMRSNRLSRQIVASDDATDVPVQISGSAELSPALPLELETS